MTNHLDRLPPHDMDAEQGVLGCSMLSREAIDQALEFGVDASWFYDNRHQTLWAEIVEVHGSGKPVDLITVGGQLKGAGQLEGVGGLAYLSELMDAVPSAANLPYYLPILKDKWQLRKLLKASTEITGAVYEKPEDVETAIAEAETAILGVRGESGAQSDTTAKKMARRAVDALQERIEGSVDGLRIGWQYLDSVTKGGWKPGDMVVIAGRPGTGKTAIAVSIARLVAASGVPVGIVSIEMSDQELAGRILAQETRFSWDDFDERNRPREDQWRRMTAAAAAVGKLPITVCDSASMTVGAIAAKARRWVRNGIRLVVIDYLQLIQGNPKLQRQEQVATISASLKRLARELRIPIIVLAQLNRDIEKDKDRKPRLSDLRESGAIEQDANFVGMLYRPKATKDEFERDESDSIEVNLFVAKNRGGRAQMDVPFIFHRSLTEFTPAHREQPE